MFGIGLLSISAAEAWRNRLSSSFSLSEESLSDDGIHAHIFHHIVKYWYMYYNLAY
jgi:hypothetical protein